MQQIWTSLSALKSSMDWLDRVSNNIANQDTPGFAQQTSSFQDLFTASLTGQATAPAAAGRYTPPGWRGGTGVMSTATESDFSTMPVQTTGNQMDFAIQGPGFFVVQGSNGQPVLTKAGNFTWTKMAGGNFVLATQNGNPVLDVNGQPITQPTNGSGQISVGPNGQISINAVAGQRMAIAEVPVPSQSLVSVGDNEYAPVQGFTPSIVNTGNTSGSSLIMQGALSQSNVNLVTQLTDSIQAQRMFDLNAQALQMSDKMEQIADQIKA